jgi:hypothetical protein
MNKRLMTWMTPWALALFLTALGAGCTSELGGEDGADPATGQTEQHVGGIWYYSWGCAGSCSLDLGTSTNRTCVLAGIRGNLTGKSTQPLVPTSVRLLGGGGTNWFLDVSSAGGHPLAGDAMCIDTSLNRTAKAFWSSGTAATPMGTGTAARRCFLTDVYNLDGFKTNSDYARVWKDATTGIWYVGGTQSGTYGAEVAATCVDVPLNYGSWLWIAGDPGSRLDDLAYNPDGVACGMTGLGGHFTANDYSDGVQIQYNSGIRTWQQMTVNGKRAWSSCVD